ncbi:MAG TPA: nicotinamide riboside transporter PnuC, partial [Gemmatimonadales bacterium]|nr:nicotinamide riboside transporter PnuC [Gemmatimonadales bacterium]
FGMSPFETVAAGFGIVSVFLSTRQNIWSWPTSLINVTMYTVIFLQQKLYGLSGIQVFFAAVSVYGWYEWLHGGAHKTELKVSRTPPRLAGILVAVGLLGWLGLFLILRLVDDASPLLDAFFFASSLVAQWMMARKLAECWLLWIAINCISVPFFFLQHIYPTMVQYAVFLVLAVMGRSQWKASLAASS